MWGGGTTLAGAASGAVTSTRKPRSATTLPRFSPVARTSVASQAGFASRRSRDQPDQQRSKTTTEGEEATEIPARLRLADLLPILSIPCRSNEER